MSNSNVPVSVGFTGYENAKSNAVDICEHFSDMGFDFEFYFSSIGVQERNDASVATNLHFPQSHLSHQFKNGSQIEKDVKEGLANISSWN